MKNESKKSQKRETGGGKEKTKREISTGKEREKSKDKQNGKMRGRMSK
jgi:hypothetical protein